MLLFSSITFDLVCILKVIWGALKVSDFIIWIHEKGEARAEYLENLRSYEELAWLDWVMPSVSQGPFFYLG